VWHGLTTHNIHLDLVLAPVAAKLDRCWWYLGGAGMRFPWIKPPAVLKEYEPAVSNGRQARKKARNEAKKRPPPGPMRFEPADWQRYLDESRAAEEEYAKWLDDSGAVAYGVGKPGFFRRYAAGMDGDWQIYYASDAPELPVSSFDECASRFDFVWLVEPPDDLPEDICVITRDIDAGYLDLFFRDEWMFKPVWDYLVAKGMQPTRYKRLEIPERWR